MELNKTNLHFNMPQLISAIVDAPFETAIFGRGTGKTEGLIASKSAKRLDTMPRCCQVFVAATFQQLLTRTLPPVIKGWAKLGYRLGVHYLIGQKPPEKWRRMWKWEGPYQPPLKFDYVVSWWNGAIIQMISQDNIGSSNGLSIDGIFGDEAKLLKHDRLKDELFPANRGLIAAFTDNPHHHGITFTSDMPVGTSGRWLLEQEKEMDVQRINQILKLQGKIQEQLTLLDHAKKTDMRGVISFIAEIEQALNYLRNDLVFYHEASTLDNLDGLGVKFIRQLMRDLDPFTFSTTILNRKPRRLEDGFYPDLNEEKHGYFAYDYHKFENVGYDFDALAVGAEVDADYNNNKPLHIGVDNNKSLTPMVVAQRPAKYEIRLINSFYSEYPEKMKHTVDQFCSYYENHKRKVVYFWYDHTLIQETGHSGSVATEIIKQLRKNDWIVIERYTGQALGHEVRYKMYGHLLTEDGYYRHYFRMNRDRCSNVFQSMYQTAAMRTKNGFGKDKSPERDPKFPQLEAPHFGEAVDMLVDGILESGLTWEEGEVASGMGMDIL
jgi:hypothetical protein